MTGDEQPSDWLARMEVRYGEHRETWRILAGRRTSHRESRPLAQQEQRREQNGLSTD